VDQPGARSVRARLVFRPRSGGALVRVDAGQVPTGKRVAVAWAGRLAASARGGISCS
jgi:hypothetical protein